MSTLTIKTLEELHVLHIAKDITRTAFCIIW